MTDINTCRCPASFEQQSSLAGIALVEYATADGSASSPTFYPATSGTLSFVTGQVLATVNLAIVTNSSLTRGDECFTLNLGTLSSGATITADKAQVHILAGGNTPVAANDFYTMTENEALSAGPDDAQPGLLDSDFDPLKTALTVAAINGTSFTGSLDYSPRGSYAGGEELTVTVHDLDDSLLGTSRRVPIAIASDWTYAAYKGGKMSVSVPGVLLPEMIAVN